MPWLRTGHRVGSSTPANASGPPPAIGPDGTVHFGCENHRFYAVRPDGTEKWRFEADGYVASAPAIAGDGTVYFGSYGGAFYALNADGTLQWQFGVPPGVNSSPALGADGTVYFGAANNGDVYALWPEGTLRWKVSLPGAVGGASPVLAPDGTVFIASGDRVYALAGEGGAVRWSFVARAEVMATPVVAADGTVLFGAMDRQFYALEPGGQVRRELALDGKVSEPALLTASGLLVFPTDDNRLHAVALGQPPAASSWPQFHRHPTRTGQGQARPAVRLVQPVSDTDFLLGDVVPLSAEASSANGAVTQVEFLGGTTVLGVATAGPPYQLGWAADRVGELVLRARATDVAGASARSAEVPIWVVDPAAPPVISESPPSVTVTNGMTVTLRVRAHGVPPLEYQWFRDGAALPGATRSELTLTNSTPADSARYRVEVRNLRGTAASPPALVTVLAPPQLRWLTRGSSPSRHAPAIGRGGLIYHGSQSRWFTCIDPRGAFEWNYVADDEIWSAAALGGEGTVYFGARDRHLYALHPDGGLRWRFSTSYAVDASPALAADGTIYCAAADGVMLAVSPDGIERWRFEAAGEIYSSPVVGADGTVFMISFGEPIPGTEVFSGRLYALRPDGSMRWEYFINERVAGSPAIEADGALYFGTPSGRFLAVNPDGTLRWQVATGGAFLENEPVIGSDGVLLIGQETGTPGTGATGGRFLAIDPNGALRWSYATPAPIYSTAAVTADGTAYFTDESQTLYALNANGTLRFTYAGSFVRGTTPALGYDGTIYLAQTTPHDLHALLGHSPPADSPWPMSRRDARHTANAGLPRESEAWFYPFNSNAFDEEVRAIAVDGTNVFVGGTFKLAGGLPARHVARWDGERWSPLGEGMDGPVNALAVFQGRLHAGGEFTQADGAAARRLARWSGSRWETVGGGVDDHVMALMVWGDSLVVGGSFRSAGEVPAQNIARWDGEAWHVFGDGVGATVQALASDGTQLFGGGANVLDYGDRTLGMVARWDGQQWSRVGTVGPQGQVRALQWHQGRLYAAGDFQFADNRAARGIAVYDGAAWSEVGGGLSDPLLPYGYALASDGTSLWVGGTFTRAGATDAGRVARWDGTQWRALGAGVERRSGTSATVVRALATRGDELFVGGTFLEADGDRTIRQFARWRSGAWASLGPAVGFVDGRFVLTLQTDRGLTYGIEASDDLRTWTRLVTFTNLTEARRFVDQRSATEPHRFYRAVSP
ncbi:MAG: PQQ-binding-like beta-propeller repeat protein [Verrucomicrobia bacterium]|nr:PQQ-binding-like beta-propeller repeat protein [Verrucomicrobiota bacterium]